jgi:TRAP-type C4-dicarboxylate transport system substrate-binding protein
MVTSLQTGAVDGAETSGLFGIALGIHQIAPKILPVGAAPRLLGADAAAAVAVG